MTDNRNREKNSDYFFYSHWILNTSSSSNASNPNFWGKGKTQFSGVPAYSKAKERKTAAGFASLNAGCVPNSSNHLHSNQGFG